jgi:hypothetical protein
MLPLGFKRLNYKTIFLYAWKTWMWNQSICTGQSNAEGRSGTPNPRFPCDSDPSIVHDTKNLSLALIAYCDFYLTLHTRQ